MSVGFKVLNKTQIESMKKVGLKPMNKAEMEKLPLASIDIDSMPKEELLAILKKHGFAPSEAVKSERQESKKTRKNGEKERKTQGKDKNRRIIRARKARAKKKLTAKKRIKLGENVEIEMPIWTQLLLLALFAAVCVHVLKSLWRYRSRREADEALRSRIAFLKEKKNMEKKEKKMKKIEKKSVKKGIKNDWTFFFCVCREGG